MKSLLLNSTALLLLLAVRTGLAQNLPEWIIVPKSIEGAASQDNKAARGKAGELPTPEETKADTLDRSRESVASPVMIFGSPARTGRDRNRQLGPRANATGAFPTESPASQRARDADRKWILEEELLREKQLLQVATQASDANLIARHTENIRLLQTELSNLH
jgi:hypothetical protein